MGSSPAGSRGTDGVPMPPAPRSAAAHSSFGPIARAGDRSGEGLSVSFEVFPPKTAEMELSLWACLERLAPLGPVFVSVTYGAGGSTRERTHRIVRRITEETPLRAAA